MWNHRRHLKVSVPIGGDGARSYSITLTNASHRTLSNIHVRAADALIIQDDHSVTVEKIVVPKDYPDVPLVFFAVPTSDTKLYIGILLASLMSAGASDALVGDLQERYKRAQRVAGKYPAIRWYYRQLCLSLWPLFCAWVKDVSGWERAVEFWRRTL
jgi:hypothetical protein